MAHANSAAQLKVRIGLGAPTPTQAELMQLQKDVVAALIKIQGVRSVGVHLDNVTKGGVMTREEKLLDAITNEPYNEVSGHRLPDGGIAIMLSHHSSLDRAVLLRIRDASDIAFMYDGDAEETEINMRTNVGGPWIERRDPRSLEDRQ